MQKIQPNNHEGTSPASSQGAHRILKDTHDLARSLIDKVGVCSSLYCVDKTTQSSAGPIRWTRVDVAKLIFGHTPALLLLGGTSLSSMFPGMTLLSSGDNSRMFFSSPVTSHKLVFAIVREAPEELDYMSVLGTLVSEVLQETNK
jgi:hypothetical protein